MRPPVFHHEIETQRLRADQGRLSLTGWCLAEGATPSPDLRLSLGDHLSFPPVRRFDRSDVRRIHAIPDSADPCGFTFEAQLPPGAHLATLEAATSAGTWHPVKRFIVLATPGLLQFDLQPTGPDRTLKSSIRVMGWCAHPTQAVKELWLDYGTQRIRCTTGLPREDVVRFLPQSPDAAHAGFISVKNLPVGRGPLRLRALTSTGETLLVDSGIQVDITVDEDHPTPFVLGNSRPELGPASRTDLAPAPTLDPVPLRILFTLFGDFTSNSAIHVANLADELAALGHACTVAVPGNVATAKSFRAARFHAADFPAAAQAAASQPYDLIHAWTTRENVRGLCTRLRAQHPATRLIVHLEDNELHILELTVGRSLAELTALGAGELDALIPPILSHPRHSRDFLAGADGVTVILDALRENVPAGRPVHTIWPAADARRYFPRPRPVAFRQALGWAENHIALFYHGNVHPSNRAEVRELYAAVLALNQQGHACTLVRLGRDSCDFLADLAPAVAPYVINLGVIEHHLHIPVLMALADYFVQPGEPDAFNDYRFPSKLPEFFSLGRPVILPRTNLGRLVEHRKEAYVLERADRDGIVAAVLELQQNPTLREQLSRGAVAYAEAHFSWARSARQLNAFYHQVIASAATA